MQRHKVARAIPWAALDSVGSAAISIISLVVLSRLLSPTEFGLIAYAQSAVLLIQAVGGAGLGEALVQKRPIEVLHYDSAFWGSLLLGLAGFISCIIAGMYLELHGREHSLGLILGIEGTACLFAGLNIVPMAMLERKLRSRTIAKRVLLSKITYVLSAVGLALWGAGLWSVVAAGVLQNLVATVVLWSTTARWPRRRMSWRHLKDLLRFGLPVMLEGTLWAAMSRVFLILVGVIHGVETLGFVSLATRATEMIGNILGILVARLGLPTFSALRDNPERMKSAFLQASEGMSLLASAAFLGLFATAPDWVPLLHGEQWIGAIPLIQILCLSGVFTYATAFTGAFLRAAGHPYVMLPLTALAGFVTLTAVGLTKGLDPIAITYAWGTRILVIAPLSLYLMQRFGRVSVGRQLRAILVPVLLSAIMFTSVMIYRSTSLEPQQHIPSLLASAAVGVISLLMLASFVYRMQLINHLSIVRSRAFLPTFYGSIKPGPSQ